MSKVSVKSIGKYNPGQFSSISKNKPVLNQVNSVQSRKTPVIKTQRISPIDFTSKRRSTSKSNTSDTLDILSPLKTQELRKSIQLPTPKPSMKASPTPKPSMKASPTPKPSMKASPTPKPSMKASPTPKPEVKASPTPKPEVKESPTPQPKIQQTPEAEKLDMLSRYSQQAIKGLQQTTGNVTSGVQDFVKKNTPPEPEKKAPVDHIAYHFKKYVTSPGRKQLKNIAGRTKNIFANLEHRLDSARKSSIGGRRSRKTKRRNSRTNRMKRNTRKNKKHNKSRRKSTNRRIKKITRRTSRNKRRRHTNKK